MIDDDVEVVDHEVSENLVEEGSHVPGRRCPPRDDVHHVQIVAVCKYLTSLQMRYEGFKCMCECQ